MSLKGRLGLITNGGKALTSDYLRHLAREGASLAVQFDSRSTSGTVSADAAARFRDDLLACTSHHIRISLHSCDLDSAAAVENLFSSVSAAHGHRRIDFVVNSIGRILKQPPSSSGSSTKEGKWKDVRSSGDEYEKMFAYAVFVDEQRRRSVELLKVEAKRVGVVTATWSSSAS